MRRDAPIVAAKRVIADAQESMAPRLLFIEGPPHSGKTRAAATVLDLKEARRMWLLRVCGRDDPSERKSVGAKTNVRALFPFIALFHQLFGFAPEASMRERKNAVVNVLERCGSGAERYGRYAKPIMELLELDEPEGYRAGGDASGRWGGPGTRRRSSNSGLNYSIQRERRRSIIVARRNSVTSATGSEGGDSDRSSHG